jgi:hypothetical protein
MALLRHCLQELRLRRGEADPVLEGPQIPVGTNCATDTPSALVSIQRRPLITLSKQSRSDQSVRA